jgi:hypothetical protein
LPLKIPKSVVKTTVSLLLITVIFFLIGREVFDASASLEWRFDARFWWSASLYFLFMVVIQLLLVDGWRRILRLYAIDPPLKEAAFSFAIPNLGKYLPGKVLLVAGRIELVKKTGTSRLVGLACFVLENIYIASAAALLCLPALGALVGITETGIITLGILLGLICLVLTFRSHIPFRFQNWVLSHFQDVPTTSVPGHSSSLRPFFLYLVVWALYGVAGWLLANQLFETSRADFIFVASAFVAAWLGGFLAFVTPGGLGVREGILVILLSAVMTPAEAGVLSLLSRLLWMVAELGLGLVIVVMSTGLKKRRSST